MKSHYRVVVIGGGIVGASVLYHLTKLGWNDIALIERRELTAGSTWHAAASFHAVNADTNLAALQSYTIGLYRDLQRESDHQLGVRTPGAITIAGTPERWEWLQAALSGFRTIGLDDVALISPEEIKKRCPILDTTNIYGGLWDPNDGYVDPYGTTHAFASAAKKAGAEVILRNGVMELHARQDGSWTIVTEKGTVTAEHIVNAAGLWAKQIGIMAGVDLPVVPMEHHYLITEAIPELSAMSEEMPAVVDLEGFTYARQEGKGLLLGVYERNPKHWNVEGAPWDFGIELIPADIDRISPELSIGFERYPVLQSTGIKRWVNGPITFTPDGNPLVGPVPGLRNYWCACGVMAGFSQGGGIGLALAQWITSGEPEAEVFGMDVARYGKFASNRTYLKATTGQFYARRFLISYPNEQLPAGRPLKTPPAYDVMSAQGARWGVSWGMEVPLYFTPEDPGFAETPTLNRSNAFPLVAAECRAVREGVTLLDTTAFSRYEIKGPGAKDFLDRLLACQLPKPHRVRLAPMLSASGHLMGDLTVLNWDDETFWLMGSYYLRSWHMRWFDQHKPSTGVAITDISDAVSGLSITGPKSREFLASLTPSDLSNAAFPFMACQQIDICRSRANVARLSVMGELGYEINVNAAEQRQLYLDLLLAGREWNLREIGFNALSSLRIEKSYGIWSREFTRAYTPAMCGLDRFVAFDKGDFIGRDAVLGERDKGRPKQRLVTLKIDANGADASGFEPVFAGGHLVGQVTSGAYGHVSGLSLALGYVDSVAVDEGATLSVDVVGKPRQAEIIPSSPIDPNGARLRQ
ncbi:FAD-dependent oxidoreductase [Mesorhizobium sp. M1A.F.Ca.ET.072.01.1.1]|uniref:GcvT family protein n=1 Tax=Mesorhizobium sp. M1A.F.Ca.ET.072.01.1.1 TaxID=2496753 RepID=UPI000FD2E4F4|nr:FAD-dependent oxidoreductase [Mesorhizobium sp. M1A.F.Ca.ET.072.01.1.1]RUW45948.1 FAD-dependent oxidoreductase [Mesorhizobium sp. M1A.F.Ca.ET.072.01.1.1]TIV04667.1 MAG: FAD-dependent oxidoreductase [Mesorhizobium sp.]